MKVLVTGAYGFVGKNLVKHLEQTEDTQVFQYDLGVSERELDKFLSECEFVFHLAGVNRPKTEDEFMTVGYSFTSLMLDKLKELGNKAPILVSSSIQAQLDNPYGRYKSAEEKLLTEYGRTEDVKVLIYRMPNVFGKWCRPNYNSVVATFCNNIANGLPITVNDENALLSLVYIDDVAAEFCAAMFGGENREDGHCSVQPVHSIKLGELAALIKSFKESRINKQVPLLKEDSIEKKLYSTYLSYLPKDEFSYPLSTHKDHRGSFTEFLRTPERGQVSINISKPGVTKGNHWHHSKNEKFLVVSGEGIIRFRKIDNDEIMEYIVSGDKLEVVDIPVGYTHNIENTGESDMVTVMWASESFDPDHPDTYFLEV